MSELRQLATFSDYGGLVRALRDRAEELDVSRLTLDEISGLPSGYSGKLLAPVPIKNLGPIALGPILGAMGVCLILAEDPQQLARVSDRLVKRCQGPARVVRATAVRWPRREAPATSGNGPPSQDTGPDPR
jgi:hypothetical protein